MMMFHSKPRTLSLPFIFFFLFFFISLSFASKRTPKHHSQSLTYLWPLPSNFTSGNHSLSVDPSLTLSLIGNGGVAYFPILDAAFDRYKGIIFKHAGFEFGKGFVRKLRERISLVAYDVVGLNIVVHSDDDEVNFVCVCVGQFCFFLLFG